MLERKLVSAALRSRSAFDTIAASPLPEAFEEPVAPLWAAIREFYERDPGADTADPVLIAGTVARASLNPKRGREYETLVRELAAEEVSVENVRAYVSGALKDKAGMALAAAIAGRKPEPEVDEALRGFEEARALGAPEEAEDGPSFRGVLRKRVDAKGRHIVSPRVLNEHIAGGVLPGHHIVIFGRPESAKTALAITMACGFARRGLKVLYIGNEDPVQDLMVRMITNLTNKTVAEIAEDPDKWELEALKAGAANIVVKATSPGTIREIEALIKAHKPKVLVVDQIRNISNGKADNFTNLLDRNAQAIRALAKRYGLVAISVTQAGDSASGKALLEMGDVDSSNTGIPGAADVMLGVGVTEALDTAGQRMVNLCKNKLGGIRNHVLLDFDPFRSKLK